MPRYTVRVNDRLFIADQVVGLGSLLYMSQSFEVKGGLMLPEQREPHTYIRLAPGTGTVTIKSFPIAGDPELS